MTLKQDNLVKAIPQAKTLRQAGLIAGYSPKSRTIYRKGTKTHIAENLQLAGITKQSLQEYFIGLGQLALQAGDISNAERSGENIAKMAGFMKDNAVQGVTVHINDAIAQLKGGQHTVEHNPTGIAEHQGITTPTQSTTGQSDSGGCGQRS